MGSYVTRLDSLYTVLKVMKVSSVYGDSLRILTCTVLVPKVLTQDVGDFFGAEQLCSIVEPRCGSCRCG